MNVCIVGCGYVGLITGATLADKGHNVTCFDVDKTKITQLQQGIMPIHEPGLDKLVKRNTRKDNEKISFTTSLPNALLNSEIIFICVGTPPNEDGSPNLAYVEASIALIAKSISKEKIIVLKSTVPVGTSERMREMVETLKKKSTKFHFVFNPEFLREGRAIADTNGADRIVIGATSLKAQQKMMELYEPFMCRMMLTDLASAELIKLASNAFLATKISFINSIAHVCDKTGANIDDVARGMGLDTRINGQFLSAGIGYGGSCFPKDIDNLIHQSDLLGYDFKILKAVKDVNSKQLQEFIDLLRERIGGFKNKTIGVLGVSFKPDTDDLRESKSIEIIKTIIDEGGSVRAHDQISCNIARKIFPTITPCISAYEVAYKADAIVVATEDFAFAKLDFAQVLKYMNAPIVFDGRNMMDPHEMKQKGFEYYSIGRPN